MQVNSYSTLSWFTLLHFHKNHHVLFFQGFRDYQAVGLIEAFIQTCTVSNSCCFYRNWSEEDINGRVPGTEQYLWILIIVRKCTSLYGLMLSHFSRVQLFVVLWTIARQASLSMGFSRQEYWSGLPFPLPGDLPNPGIKPASLISPALVGRFFTPSATWEVRPYIWLLFIKKKSMKINAWRFVQFSRSVVSDSLWPRDSQHARPSCPSPTLGVYPNSCPFSQWCHPAISSSVVPFFHPQSFPASGSFQMSQLFASGGQSIAVSASTSFLPVNTQDWSPLGWTGWISLQPKGLSRVFSNTTVQKHQFFGAQVSSQSNSHIHTWPLEKP